VKGEPENSENEVPRSEPEIIPPSRAGSKSDFGQTMWFRSDRRGVHRLYVARLGPFSLILLALAAIFVAVCVIFLLVGLVLLWIPVVVMLMLASIAAVLLRNNHQR
jgi:hypothetical protein